MILQTNTFDGALEYWSGVSFTSKFSCGQTDTRYLWIRKIWTLFSYVKVAIETGETPLHSSCRRGRLEVVKFLQQSGADVNATTEQGETPIFISAKHGHREITIFLMQKTFVKLFILLNKNKLKPFRKSNHNLTQTLLLVKENYNLFKWQKATARLTNSFPLKKCVKFYCKENHKK